MKIDCNKIEKLLSSFIDDELDKKDSLELNQHIKECRKCSEELNNLREIKNLLKSRKAVEPPPFLENRVISAIKELKTPQGLKWQIFPEEWKLIPLFSVILVALVFIWGNYNTDTISSSPIEEYLYSTITAENNTILLDETSVSQDDVLEVFLNL